MKTNNPNDYRKGNKEDRIERLAEKFLVWKLPSTVRSDEVATMRGCPDRTGTNLMDLEEAKQMIRYLLDEPVENIEQLPPIPEGWEVVTDNSYAIGDKFSDMADKNKRDYSDLSLWCDVQRHEIEPLRKNMNFVVIRKKPDTDRVEVSQDSPLCPNCGACCVFPRGDKPYCEECGYPDEDLLEYRDGCIILHDCENEDLFAFVTCVPESYDWTWYAIDERLDILIKAGSEDSKGTAVRAAIDAMEAYGSKTQEKPEPDKFEELLERARHCAKRANDFYQDDKNDGAMGWIIDALKEQIKAIRELRKEVRK